MKNCKGIGRAYGVDGCGKPSNRRKFGLCPSCLFEWSQTNDNGKIWYQSQFLPKVKQVTKKRQKEKDKAFRESLKSIAGLIQEARVPFQKWIRFRDANEGCISCGTTTSEIWDAGHYFKAELYTGLIFDEMNVNKQCGKCNRFLAGNESECYKGLIKKYGKEAVQELQEKANALRSYKFTREEIKEIKTKYQKLCKL